VKPLDDDDVGLCGAGCGGCGGREGGIGWRRTFFRLTRGMIDCGRRQRRKATVCEKGQGGGATPKPNSNHIVSPPHTALPGAHRIM
jgi:hypothetical protein